jgi:hypothetical protein
MKISTYRDFNVEACELECAPRPRLVYRCWIYKGPGFTEKMSFHYGPTVGGDAFALWMSSDWSSRDSLLRYAVAWTTAKDLPAKPWAELLKAYWTAERDDSCWNKPNYSEIEPTPRSLMTPEEIQSVARIVWPKADF